MYKISVDYDLNDADKEIILEGMLAFTKSILGHTDFIEKPFSVLLKDENQKLYGGIVAKFDTESLYVDLLWVHETLRYQGYGSKLLNTAENEAKKFGCRYATLDTYSFEAEDFYLKNGYKRLGEIKNYYLNHSKIFLRKNLV